MAAITKYAGLPDIVRFIPCLQLPGWSNVVVEAVELIVFTPFRAGVRTQQQISTRHKISQRSPRRM